MENRLRNLVQAETDLNPGPGTAAVAVVTKAGPHVLVVKRAVREDDPWSGQIAFPGGRWKTGDRSLLETALRELEEETGMPSDAVEVLGPMKPVSPANMPTLKVLPFLLLHLCETALKPGAEVEKVFWLPLKQLEKGNFTVYSRSLGRELTTVGYRYRSEVIWGMTARLLEVLEQAVTDGV